MNPLRLLVVLLTMLLFFLIGAIDDNYDDYFIDPSNDTDEAQSEQYSILAARLNCSKLAIRHKGIKIEEIRSNSILKTVPRVAPNQVKRVKAEETIDESQPKLRPFLSYDHYYTLPPELFDRQENLTEDTLIPLTNFDYFTYPNEFTQRLLNLTADYDQQELNLTADYDQQELNLPIAYQEENHIKSTENVSLGVASLNDSTELNNNYLKLDNSTKSNDTKEIPECAYAFDNDGPSFNWYEVIVRNGGVPGEVNGTRLTPNITKVLEPCHRPVTNTSPPFGDMLYEYELLEFDKVYRREKAFLRFAGTPSEFVDILGQLIWAPTEERRYFRLSYRKDDTGFYVYIRRGHKCVFEKNPLTVKCHLVADFAPCANMTDTRTLSAGLRASLVG